MGVLSATIIEFDKVDPDAAKLMLPYLGWSTFAAVLTLDPEVHQEYPLTADLENLWCVAWSSLSS